MTENITVKIIEQPGEVSQMKASQLSHVIVNFIQKHPEITQTNENNRLEDENENLRTELSGLMKRVDTLTKQVEKMPTATLEVAEPEITIQTIRAAMQQAYQDAAHADCKGDEILHMVWGFEYLLQRLGAE